MIHKALVERGLPLGYARPVRPLERAAWAKHLRPVLTLRTPKSRRGFKKGKALGYNQMEVRPSRRA